MKFLYKDVLIVLHLMLYQSNRITGQLVNCHRFQMINEKNCVYLCV